MDTVLPTLHEQVAHARTVAAALAVVPGGRVFPDPPHTHQFQFWLPYPASVLNDAGLELAEQEKVWFVGDWQETSAPGVAMSEVSVLAPALELSADDVTDLAQRFLARLPPS